jgi:hypothetical protein
VARAIACFAQTVFLLRRQAVVPCVVEPGMVDPPQAGPAEHPAEPSPRRRGSSPLRTVLDLLAEGALTLAFLGATVVTWVPATERPAMLQTGALGAAIGVAYALAAVVALRRRRALGACSHLELVGSAAPEGLRAAAGFVVAVLALLRFAGAPAPG